MKIEAFKKAKHWMEVKEKLEANLKEINRSYSIGEDSPYSYPTKMSFFAGSVHRWEVGDHDFIKEVAMLWKEKLEKQLAEVEKRIEAL